MTRNDFIHRAALTILHAGMTSKIDDWTYETWDERLNAAIDIADDFANAMQNGGEAPWDSTESDVGRIAGAINAIGTPGSPLFVIADDGKELDGLGMRDTAGTKDAVERVKNRGKRPPGVPPIPVPGPGRRSHP